MIDIDLYRSRIGNFSNTGGINRIRKLKKMFRNQWRGSINSGDTLSFIAVFIKIILIFVLLQPSWHDPCTSSPSPATTSLTWPPAT